MDMDIIGPIASLIGVVFLFMKLPSWFKKMEVEDEKVSHRHNVRPTGRTIRLKNYDDEWEDDYS